MHIHRAFVALGVHAPDFIHQLPPGENLPGAAEQLEQQVEFLLGQGDGQIAPGYGQRVVVQEGFAHGQLVAGHGLGAPQQRSHMEQQLVQIDGLGQVVVRPAGKAGALVLQGGAGGDQHDGQKGIGPAQFLRQLPAVHHGHHHVGNHQVGHGALDLGKRFLAVARGDGLIAVQTKEGAHHALQGQVVLRHQYGKHGALLSLREILLIPL